MRAPARRTAAGAALAAALALAALALAPARRVGAHMSHAKFIRGAVTYQMYCAGCHGASGRGDGPRAADGLSRPVDLTALARGGRFDRREVAARVDGAARPAAHGESELPVWGAAELRPRPAEHPGGDAFPPRLVELLDYLEHLQDRR